MKKSILCVLTSFAFISASFSAWSAPELPASIKDKGSITVAMMPNYPPLDFKDPLTNKLTGVDYDIGTAIGEKLGIKINWQEVAFEQMVNAVVTKRVDMVMSGMTDTKERQQVVNFIDYFTSGPQFYTTTSREDLHDAKDLCGKRVGTSRRTTFPQEIAAWSKENCEASGKPAVIVVGAEGTADARTQLRQRRVDAVVQGSETLPYIMSLDKNSFKPLGKAFAKQLTGMAIGKDQAELTRAIQWALDELIADGTYQKILDKWELPDSAVEKAGLNQG